MALVVAASAILPARAAAPESYLEYVATDGSAYIDTGVIGKAGTKVEAGMMWGSISGDIAFVGARNGTDGRYLPIHVYDNKWWFGYKNQKGGYGTPATNTYYAVTSEVSSAGVYTLNVNGTTYSANYSSSVGNYSSGLPLYLFALSRESNGVNNKAPAGTRCYYLKIWQDGVLVRDYKPCYHEGIVTLYDAQNDTYATPVAGMLTTAGMTITPSDPQWGAALTVGNGETITIDAGEGGTWAGTVTVNAGGTLKTRGALTVTGTTRVNAGGALDVETGTSALAFKTSGNAGSTTIRAGAVLEIGAKEVFTSAATVSVDIYGTLSCGVYHQRFDGGSTCHFRDGSRMTGEGDSFGGIYVWSGTSRIVMHGTVTLDTPICCSSNGKTLTLACCENATVKLNGGVDYGDGKTPCKGEIIQVAATAEEGNASGTSDHAVIELNVPDDDAVHAVPEFTLTSAKLRLVGGGVATFPDGRAPYPLEIGNATVDISACPELSVGGALTLGADAKLSCDTALAPAFRIETTGGVTLPAGSTIADFVEPASLGATATLADGGNTILAGYAAGDVVKAVWKGAVGASGTSADSWTCTDATGAVVAGTPGAKTKLVFGGDFAPSIPAASALTCLSVEFASGARLAAASDMSGLSVVSHLAGVLDLNGHALQLSATQYPRLGTLAAIADTSVSGGGTLALFVAEGETMNIDEVFIERTMESRIADNVKLAKTGPGAITATRLNIGDVENQEFVQESGTLTMTNKVDSTIGGADSAAHGHGVYRLNGGSLTVPSINLMVGTYGTGELYQTGGSVKVTNNWISVGRYSGGKGTYELTGGTVSAPKGGIIAGESGEGSIKIGGNASVEVANAYVSWNASGRGDMTVKDSASLRMSNNFIVGGRAAGTFTQSSGTVQCNAWLSIGRYTDGNGTYTMTDGTYTSSNYAVLVGEEGTGLFDICGTAVANAQKGVIGGYKATAVGTLRVHDGGTLVTPFVSRGPGRASFSFDGATLQAYGNGATVHNFFRNMDDVSIGPGGLTLDVGNNTVVATGTDLSPKSIEGTITKTGAGSLVFDTPPPVERLAVNEGTLLFSTRTKPVLAHRWSFNGDYRDSVTGDVAVPSGAVVFTNDNTQVHLEGGNRGTSMIDLGANRLPSDSVTIELWTTMRTGRTWAKAVCLGKDTGNALVITYTKSDATGPTCLELRNSLSNVEGTGTLVTNVPYHIALTLTPNGKNGSRARMYVRNLNTGALLGTIDMDGANWTVSNSLVQNVFWLGRSFWGDADASADFDEVRVWNGVLSEEELAAHAAIGPDALPGEDAGNVLAAAATDEIKANNYLLHRWNFNGNANDQIGDKDAVFKGTTPPTYFNGTSVRLAGGGRGKSWIELGANMIPASLGDAPFTVECWLTTREVRNWCQAFAFGSNGRTDDNAAAGTSGIIFSLRKETSPYTPSFHPIKSSMADNLNIGDAALVANLEYHLALTVVPGGDGNSATIRAYVMNAATGEVLARREQDVTKWTTSKIVQDAFRLGHSWWNDYDTMADYNEVRFWAAALSEEQLRVNNAYGPDVIPAITDASALPSAELGVLDVATGAKVDLGGNPIELATVSGTGEISNGALTVSGCLMPGGDGTVGTLVVTSDAAITGTVKLDVGDAISSSGALDLTGATIVVSDPANLGSRMVFATSATGGIVGPVKAFDLKGYSVRIARDGRSASISRNGFHIFVR